MTETFSKNTTVVYKRPLQVRIFNPNTGVTSEFKVSSVEQVIKENKEFAFPGIPVGRRSRYPQVSRTYSYKFLGISDEEIFATRDNVSSKKEEKC